MAGRPNTSATGGQIRRIRNKEHRDRKEEKPNDPKTENEGRARPAKDESRPTNEHTLEGSKRDEGSPHGQMESENIQNGADASRGGERARDERLRTKNDNLYGTRGKKGGHARERPERENRDRWGAQDRPGKR